MAPTGEAVEPFLRMVAGFNRDKDGHAEPDAVLVDQRHTLLNDPVGLQPLNALPAWRRRQANAGADLGDRAICVFLQNCKYFPINGVHEIFFFQRDDWKKSIGEKYS